MKSTYDIKFMLECSINLPIMETSLNSYLYMFIKIDTSLQFSRRESRMKRVTAITERCSCI